MLLVRSAKLASPSKNLANRTLPCGQKALFVMITSVALLCNKQETQSAGKIVAAKALVVLCKPFHQRAAA